MKIAIVNDLRIAQEILKKVVTSIPEYSISWIAFDGQEAIDKAAIDTPDLILMDLIMPNVDGVKATQEIMKKSKCAILIVTATVEGNGDRVYEAMGYGALDAVCTPIVGVQGSIEGATSLLEKIQHIGLMINRVNPLSVHIESPLSKTVTHIKVPANILAIGASTGGPQVLQEILSKIPTDFAFPIVIIQHIDAAFANGLVIWLKRATTLKVELAQNKSKLEPGTVYLAGTDDHLIFSQNGVLEYTPEPLDMVYRPSIDVFFKSLARNYPYKGIALILTGMGQDGAEGMLMLRKKGWFTIAQDKDSCVVYSMPKAAVQQGAAMRSQTPAEIVSSIIDRLHKVPAK